MRSKKIEEATIDKFYKRVEEFYYWYRLNNKRLLKTNKFFGIFIGECESVMKTFISDEIFPLLSAEKEKWEKEYLLWNQDQETHLKNKIQEIRDNGLTNHAFEVIADLICEYGSHAFINSFIGHFPKRKKRILEIRKETLGI